MNFGTSIVCGTLAMGVASYVYAAPAQISATAAAEGVVERVTPTAKGSVFFKLTPSKGEKITISAHAKGIQVEAADVRRLIAGYGWYLNNVAKVHFSWNGDRLNLPKKLPAPKSPVTIESPWNTVFAYNYCTLSYTAPFWGWQRWQHELDFLALSGFTHALVTAGLEKVWQDFLSQQGYPKSKIVEFIPNPAFAAWWNMGNLEGHGGPLSQAQVDKLALLGKKIVTRMEELGMTPVLQGYVGFIPADFEKTVKVPGMKVVPQGDWVGFKRPWVVDPTCEAFPKLANEWYKSLHKVYGIKGRMYGGDLFHEGGNSGGINVTDAAAAVQTAMQKASPKSTWVIQSWGHNPTQQLLDGINPEWSMVLHLTKNQANGGKNQRTYGNAKGQITFVWCELANFGGNTGLYGGLPLLARLGTDLKEYESKGLIGMGTLSEGLEINPLHYAMFCDRLWTKKDIDIDSWLKAYAHRRYGKAPKEVVQGLTVLKDTIYNPAKEQEGCTESIICARPDWGARKASTWASSDRYYKLSDVVKAARFFMDGANKNQDLMKTETFHYDLVDVIRQVLADAVFYQLQVVKRAFDSRDLEAYKKEVGVFLGMIKDADLLLASDKQFLLGTWQKRALAMGANEKEKALMDRCCKMLITTWIDRAPEGLNDYSNRQWAGLIKDFYLPRWQKFFALQQDVLEGKKDSASAGSEFMQKTCKDELAFAENGVIYPAKATGDTFKIANMIMSKYSKTLDSLCAEENNSSGLPWDLNQGKIFNFEVTDRIDAVGTYTVTMQWKTGDSALRIKSVKLYQGNTEVAADVHDGQTGWDNINNTYTLKLDKYRTNLDAYTLKGEAEGVSSNNSQGEMIIRKKK